MSRSVYVSNVSALCHVERVAAATENSTKAEESETRTKVVLCDT